MRNPVTHTKLFPNAFHFVLFVVQSDKEDGEQTERSRALWRVGKGKTATKWKCFVSAACPCVTTTDKEFSVNNTIHELPIRDDVRMLRG